jgi:hypothetical protein
MVDSNASVHQRRSRFRSPPTQCLQVYAIISVKPGKVLALPDLPLRPQLRIVWFY